MTEIKLSYALPATELDKLADAILEILQASPRALTGEDLRLRFEHPNDRQVRLAIHESRRAMTLARS